MIFNKHWYLLQLQTESFSDNMLSSPSPTLAFSLPALSFPLMSPITFHQLLVLYADRRTVARQHQWVTWTSHYLINKYCQEMDTETRFDLCSHV